MIKKKGGGGQLSQTTFAVSAACHTYQIINVAKENCWVDLHKPICFRSVHILQQVYSYTNFFHVN